MLSDVAAFEPVPDPRPEDSAWPPMRWPPPPDVSLCGQIIELAPAAMGRDAAPLFEALDAPKVWQYIKSGRPADASELRRTLEQIAAVHGLSWVLRLRVPYLGLPVGSVIGTSSYLDVVPEHARLEIGTTLYSPPVWASGVNPEAKLLLLAHAFDELGVGRVHLVTDARNQRSQRAIARLGARHEATLRRYERRADGTMRDTVMFSIVAEEWPTVRARLEARVAEAVAAFN